jgi:hypothetical protein
VVPAAAYISFKSNLIIGLSGSLFSELGACSLISHIVRGLPAGCTVICELSLFGFVLFCPPFYILAN